jgi:hypothetical protein
MMAYINRLSYGINALAKSTLQKTWFISTRLFQGFIKNLRNKPVKRR